MQSLPDAGITKVVGLIEVLHDHGSEDETVKLAEYLQLDLDALLPVVEAGEMLGMITVSGGKIKLTETGSSLIGNKISDRKATIGKKVALLEPFKKLLEILKTKKNGRIQKKALQKILRQDLPRESADKTLSKLIEWGRHVDLIGYESDSEELYLANP
ncbi:AAA-associated domain-containing protein [Candidatus Micrarchaeota archaeon]|nr:AAA-associated domain-containing protein [Candidatus Micrarchaeota archaeon]